MKLSTFRRLLTLCFTLPTLATSFSYNTSKSSIPITVLSGFLGAGKTSLLQNLLQNKDGKKIALVVNDVASINIDSKLVKNNSAGDASGIVELQNGCACCSLSEELFGSLEELVLMSDVRGNDEAFEHIVIELSGVADPKSIRSKFQEAIMYDMPLMTRVNLDTMVTVVDCSTFLDHLSNAKYVNPDDTPELFYRNGEERPKEEEWMKGLDPMLLEVLLAGRTSNSISSNSAVADLLVSQTEIADVVLLNKQDLVDDDSSMERIQDIVLALNPRARVLRTEYGRVPLVEVLASANGQGVVMAGVVDDHKDAVEAVLHAATDCSDPDCTDTSHSHSHSHNHDCSDPDCADKSHSHSHTHHATAEKPLYSGIGTYIYRARRPFHPKRLVSFLNHLPVKRGVPEMKDGDPIELSDATTNALQNVIRSKGFVWCADSHQKALYWSHSGVSFELQCLGSWWATLPRDQWPEEAVSSLIVDFDDPNHDENDQSATTVGDRRQELVVIGTGLGDPAKGIAIGEGLDRCLLTEQEWETYRRIRDDDEKLRTAFFSPIVPQMVSV